MGGLGGKAACLALWFVDVHTTKPIFDAVSGCTSGVVMAVVWVTQVMLRSWRCTGLPGGCG